MGAFTMIFTLRAMWGRSIVMVVFSEVARGVFVDDHQDKYTNRFSDLFQARQQTPRVYLVVVVVVVMTPKARECPPTEIVDCESAATDFVGYCTLIRMASHRSSWL